MPPLLKTKFSHGLGQALGMLALFWFGLFLVAWAAVAQDRKSVV